jgi:ABC-2 type transport system ATP-binding protein
VVVGLAAIDVHGLTKQFGSFQAVAGVDLQVNYGEIFGFIGPNGSGKSTTIRMLCGLLRPTAGGGTVLGYDLEREAEQIRQGIGYMSQRFSLYKELTVRENMQFYAGAYSLTGRTLQQRLDAVMEVTGLSARADQIVADLATGWRQRLALASALLHEPLLVFLDEPTAGVDPLTRRDFWGLLYRMAADGMTFFVTTYFMDEAEHCHRLACIDQGRIVASGDVASLAARLPDGHKVPPGVPVLEEVFVALTEGRLKGGAGHKLDSH